MTGLKAAVLFLVAAGGLAVVATREPKRQLLVASFNGLLLGLFFFVYQAPDVALSQIAVGVAYPVMTLLALTKAKGPNA